MEIPAIVPLPTEAAEHSAAVFAPLAGEAPLAHVLTSLLVANIDSRRIVVAAADPLIADVRTSLTADRFASIAVVGADGAATRAQCITAGLEYLAAQSFSTRHVLLHDWRCLLAPAELTSRVITALGAGHPAVLPMLPVTDSVKAVDSAGSITGTVDRAMLRNAQYPRGFSVDQLSRLLTDCPGGDFDEIGQAVRTGVPVSVVDGEPGASPVDLPGDHRFVAAVIATRRAGTQSPQ